MQGRCHLAPRTLRNCSKISRGTHRCNINQQLKIDRKNGPLGSKPHHRFRRKCAAEAKKFPTRNAEDSSGQLLRSMIDALSGSEDWAPVMKAYSHFQRPGPRKDLNVSSETSTKARLILEALRVDLNNNDRTTVILRSCRVPAPQEPHNYCKVITGIGGEQGNSLPLEVQPHRWLQGE